MTATTHPAPAIRAWAVDNGYPDVAGKRGRLKTEITDAFAKLKAAERKPFLDAHKAALKAAEKAKADRAKKGAAKTGKASRAKKAAPAPAETVEA